MNQSTLDTPTPQPEVGLAMTAPQLGVVHHGDGPLLVLAGAGSGKTASIVTRAGRMINEGIIPEHHLMLTFSKKAAEESGSLSLCTSYFLWLPSDPAVGQQRPCHSDYLPLSLGGSGVLQPDGFASFAGQTKKDLLNIS